MKRALAALLLATFIACGRTDPLTFEPLRPVADRPPADAGPDASVDGGHDGGARDAGPADAGADAGRDGGIDGGFDGGRDAGPDGGVDAGSEPGLAADDLVYLHDNAALFTWAPGTNVVSRVGTVSCIRPTDLAIDRLGRAFMVSGSTLYRLNLQTGVCTPFATLPEPLVTLQFLPAGVVDALEEGLVGYGQQTYWQFELSNGMALALGTSSLGMGLVPSGDLTALDDGGAFLSVRGGTCNDCLVRVDPQTGAVVERLGPIGASRVWGLATFDDTLYGFTASGGVLRLRVGDGGVQSQQVATSNVSFWGAAARPGARSRRDGG
ncbi:MAG: hypothetical protein JNJ54_26625 [Myxococcaceae bacterium]|nr:hypothetical protein [Myxococcaceae bacterium]